MSDGTETAWVTAVHHDDVIQKLLAEKEELRQELARWRSAHELGCDETARAKALTREILAEFTAVSLVGGARKSERVAYVRQADFERWTEAAR